MNFACFALLPLNWTPLMVQPNFSADLSAPHLKHALLEICWLIHMFKMRWFELSAVVSFPAGSSHQRTVHCGHRRMDMTSNKKHDPWFLISLSFQFLEYLSFSCSRLCSYHPTSSFILNRSSEHSVFLTGSIRHGLPWCFGQFKLGTAR